MQPKTLPTEVLIKRLLHLFLLFLSIHGFSQTTDTFTSSGTWTCPTGVTSISVEAYGAGGAGGAGGTANKNGGGGGGGGAYMKNNTVTVVPGTNYTITIGAGGNGGAGNGGDGGNTTATFGGITITANGGAGGRSYANGATGGNGGTAGTYAGGSGGTGTTGGSAGGGGCAGTTGNGGNGAVTAGGTAGGGTVAGAGANGKTNNAAAGNIGNNFGGGGSGGTKGSNGGNGAGGYMSITYTPPGTYCTPTNTSSTSYYISGVTTTGGVANINNTPTGFSAYTNYSSQFVSQYPNSTFSITASHPSSTYGYNVWVDWNSDGDFADAGENVISTGYLSTPASLGNVTIPIGQAPGDYRMRIRNAYLSNPAPACGSFGYGEAEDYTVRVIALPSCSGTPTAGTVTTSPTSGAPGSTYTVSASGFTNASGLTFQWQYSTNGGGTWTNAGTATGTYANYIATAPGTVGTTVLWHLVVTCTSSGQSATSSNGTFTTVSTLNVPATGSNTVTCGTNITLYDNGGPSSDYAYSSNGYTVLEAGLGATITINGAYTTESTYDFIRIYSGTGTGGTLLASYSGTGTINYTGVAGQTLTIQFTSDSITNYSGFSLSVTYSGTCFPACTGTPVGGTVTTNPTSGGPGSSYTVSATGMTLATGMTYQWQYSTNGGGTWTNAGTATSTYSNYIATAPGTIGTTVLWHLVVTCTSSGQSATSSNGTFNTVATINVPASGNNTVACGTNVTLYDNGGISGDYANSSDGYTVLQAGAAGIINISGNYVTESVDYIRIYDGTGTAGTLLATYSGSSGGTINYTGAPGQTLTIRFSSDSSVVYSGFALAITYSGACTLSPCTGTPVGGTVTTNPNTGWPGSSYTVSATGYEIALNLTYQWQYSLDGGATWVNAGAATGTYANYMATAPASGNVLWHLLVTCTNSGQTGTSSNGTFVTMAVSDVETGCPNVVSGGLGLSGADPVPFNCTDTSTCVDLEATYLDLGDTTSYIVEPILYNPPFAFNNLANPVSVNIDDVWSPTVTLPFNFCFYGNTYTQCLIGSNGVITFDTVNNTPGGTCSWSFDANLPVAGDNALVENAIFGVFHDINPGVGGEVGWELITLPSGCRALVASWYNVPLFGDNSQFYTGMMVLYENSNVIEVYIQHKPNDPDAWNDNNAVVGIQNATGTIASVAPGRNGLDADWVTSNEAWRFVPNGSSIASIKWYEGAGVSGPVVGTTPTITVCPSATTTYTAEITYTLCDGRTITEVDDTTVTVNGAKVWNGSVNTDWNNNNNWTPTGRPTAADCVVIPDTANDPVISGSGYNGLGLNMSIQNNAMLTVNSNNSVTITDWVNISATGELFLDNAANLVQVNNVANSGAGTMRMERDVNIKRLDYVYWSSPVTSFASSLISPTTATNLIWKWRPTVSGNGIGNSGDWTNGNEIMTLGRGYIVRGPSSYTSTPQNYTATFVGTPNNGNISTQIKRGSYTSGTTYQVCATCTPATALDDNWNLIGNPYPSAIRAIDFLTANPSIDGYIKIWTHGTLPSSAIVDPFYNGYVYNYTIGDYITYNNLGASSGPGTFNGYIGAGQGFFVSMLDSAATPSNVNFTNALRSAAYDNAQFFRTEAEEKHRIWLDIINTTSNASTRTLVGYVDDATYDRDRLFDAITDTKMDLNIYSLVDQEGFTIQGRPTPFDDNDIVPLGFKVPASGNYSIAISALDGLFESTSQAIYLHDLELNIVHDLRTMPYSFQANEGIYNNRFNLVYKNNLSENSNELLQDSVWLSTTNNLMVHSNNQNIASVKVFDILGRVLTTKLNLSAKAVALNEILKTNSGLILEITLDNNKVIYKKMVY